MRTQLQQKAHTIYKFAPRYTVFNWICNNILFSVIDWMELFMFVNSCELWPYSNNIVTHHRELGAIIPIRRDDGVEVMPNTSWGRLFNGHGGCAPALPRSWVRRLGINTKHLQCTFFLKPIRYLFQRKQRTQKIISSQRYVQTNQSEISNRRT